MLECSHHNAYPHTKSRDLPFTQVKSWSPRGVIRVDDTGTHRYSTVTDLPTTPPIHPWTFYLADTAGKFRLLGFDFDDHHGAHADAVVRDVDSLTAWCDATGVPYLVCASGGGAGRHVWIRLTGPAEPATVRHLAHGLKHVLPTLDIAPLCNPNTGMLRAPGSAHRSGGHSIVLPAGARTVAEQFAYASRGTTPDVVNKLTAWCGTTSPTDSVTVTAPARTIDTGRNKLRGPKRALHEHIRTLADTPLADATDASRVAWRILLHMAYCRWSLTDVQSAADTMPGLVHLTHRRDSHGRRTPRTRKLHYTRRRWCDALDAAAHYHGDNTITRPPIDTELTTILHAAHRDPTLTCGTTAAALRVVLYALMAVARDARSLEVDISIRRWALRCGMTKSSLHRHVQTLVTAGWAERTHIGRGTKADTYRLTVPTIPPVRALQEVSGTQRCTPPPHGGLPTDLETMTARLTHHCHDIWTDGGLGLPAAVVHAALVDGGPCATVRELAEAVGFSEEMTASLVAALQADHLVMSTHLEAVDGEDMYVAAAVRHGVDGVLAQRERRYRAESVVWAWWCDELDWRKRKGSGGPRIGLQAVYGRFPRTNGDSSRPGTKYIDWRAAIVRVMQHLSAGTEGARLAAA